MKLHKILLLALFCQTASAADSVEFSDISWTFQDNKGKGAAEVTKTEVEFHGKKEEGLRILLKKGSGKHWNQKDTLTVSFKSAEPVDMFDKYRVLDFTFRCKVSAGAMSKFTTLTYFNVNGSKQNHNVAYASPKFANVPDTFTYHQDMQRNPNWIYIGDTDGVNEIRLVFHLAKLPSQEVIVEIGKIRAVEENTWAHDPDRDKKWKDWIHWIKTWQPDYSDSSKYLLPPEKGRIAKPLNLTVDGKPNAEIILNDEPSGAVRLAAEELRYWIKRISGAALPIVTEPGNMPVKIYLNPADAQKLFPEDLEYLKPDGKIYSGEDGFYVRTRGNSIYIGGNIPKGTQNGVFRFLENNTDIIWTNYNPNYGTVYSENKNIKAVWADDVLKPRSKYRGTIGGDKFYKIRNLGNDKTLGETRFGSGFFADGLLESYLDHEEFYALNGDPDKGYVRNRVMYYQAQACLREEAFEHTRDEMLALIKRDREKGRYYTVLCCGVEDNWNVCCCEECTQPITLPDGTVLTSEKISKKESMSDKERRYRSNQYWTFINRLAEALREVYPEMSVGALDYFYAETPPDIPLEPNIHHIFAPLYPSHVDLRNPLFSPANKIVWHHVKKFSKQPGVYDMYEYYYSSPIAEVAKWDFIQYMELGWKGFGWEHAMDNFGGQLSIEMVQEYWLMYRLMWDPYKYEVQDLRKYYIRRVFHEGAPVIEKLLFTMLKKVYSGVYATNSPNWGYWGIMEKHGEEISNMFKEYLPKVKNPIARLNYGRMMLYFESIYSAWKDAKAGKKMDGKTRNFRKHADQLTRLFYGGWDDNFKADYGVADTLMEENGSFKPAVRLVFPNEKQFKRRFSFMSGAKVPQQKDKVILPGFIRFKIKTVVPGKNAAQLPFFCINTPLGGEYALPKRDYKTDAQGITRVKFSPSGTGISLDDITGFGIRFDKNQLDSRKPYAEFLFYDFEICPETLEGAGEGEGKTEDIAEVLDEYLN